MAAISFDATLQTPDGKTHDVNFVHVNFDGTDDEAKDFYERGHVGIKVVKLKRLGLVAAGDAKKLTNLINEGEAPAKPLNVVNG